MKKYRVALLILVALLLLAPTGILIVRAAAVGNFPKAGDAVEVRITKPDRSVVTLTKADPLYDVVYDLLQLTDRVAKSKLPDEHETYTLEFNDNGVIETLKLYVATAEEKCLECYVLSSQNRLYRLNFPTLHIRTRTYCPSRVDWIRSIGGEEQTLYTYPETPADYRSNHLYDWGKAEQLSSDQTLHSPLFYRLYDENHALITTLTDASKIAEYSPAYVLCVTKWKLLSDTFIEHTYVFDINVPELK